MASVKEAWASSASLTVTINSLASSQTVGRASTVVDNSTDLALDALLAGTFVLAAGSPANDKCVYVYGYGSIDAGSNYTESVTGSDASFTINNPTNLRLITAVATPTGGGTYKFGPVSVAAAFGGTLPQRWGIVVVNYSGLALAASGNAVSYQELTATVA